MSDFASGKAESSEKSYVNWLYHVKGVGRKRMHLMLSRGNVAKEIYEMSGNMLRGFLSEKCGFSEKQTAAVSAGMEDLRKRKTPEQLMEELYQKKIVFLLPGDNAYPKKLEKIPDAPFALYMKGRREAAEKLSEMSVAVIGARECSLYGRKVAEYIGKRCAQRGLPLVSGMACGVDGIAQWASLCGDGIVAGVLGSGVDVCYPPSNQKLYDGLIAEGCIYSEYVPGTEPKPTNFPPRNRIISGMSDAIVVVEAKEKSGTLITVDMALEQGKEVYVVPGRINDPMSKGCHRLIYQGASVVCDVDEMIEEILRTDLYDIDAVKNNGSNENVLAEGKCNPYLPGDMKHIIFRVLDIQPQTVQQIFDSRVWELEGVKRPSIPALQTELFFMQMQGSVWERNGRFGIP